MSQTHTSGEAHTGTVLLAEEDDDLRDQLAWALRREGYTVVEVEDGLELEDYLLSALVAPAILPRPDVIVSDAEMPGHTGIEMVQWLRDHHSHTPVVLLNAKCTEGVYDSAEALEVEYVLEGPVDEEEVCDAVYMLG